MASLVDQYGNPIKKQELLIEQATPSMTGVRQILSGYQTSGLDPYRLSQIMKCADQGDMTAYLELAEEIEEKDTHYLSVMGTRKRAVSQLEINVIPASDDKIDQDAAKLVEDWLFRQQLQQELFDILDAIGKGFSVVEIIWDTSEGQWLPKDLVWKDPRWFQFDKLDGKTLRLRGDAGEAIPLLPNKFIIHMAKAKSGLPVRGGLVRPCSWMWLFKNFSIKDWAIFCEAYGQPIRIGRYNAGASQKDKDILMRAVANIGSDAAAIIPESMQIEFIEAAGKSGTVDAFEKFCNFCDRQISKAVLGQTTTTDAISSGLAGNQSHNDVRGDIERADAQQLATTINQQLIPLLVAFNMGPMKRYPIIRIGDQESVDIEKLSKAADVGAKLGMKISASKLRDKLGLPAPVDDQDILVPPTTPTQPTDPNIKGSANIAKSVSSAQTISGQDAVDMIVDDMSGDWEEIMTPLADQLESAFEECQNFDELKQKLLELTQTVRSDELQKVLDKASTNMRIAGQANVPLAKE